jgi:hypothetical protein
MAMRFGKVMGCGAIVVLSFGYQSLSGWAEAGTSVTVAENAVESQPSHCRCSGDLGPSVAKIKRVLADPLKSCGLDFSDEPLQNVIGFLQSEYAIPVEIETPALEDAGIALDEPVTANFNNISLNSALRLMLERKHLTFVIQDEVLLITTPDAAEARLMACVYDVRDLIGDDNEGKHIAALVDVILSCVASGSWAENGDGEAEIKRLQPGLLVISQTRAAHDEVAELLALIRETIRQPIEPPVSEAPNPEMSEAE